MLVTRSSVGPARRLFRPGLLALGSLALQAPVHAGAALYSYGSAAGDAVLPRCDDCSVLTSLNGTGLLGTDQSLPFFALRHTGTYINNNGLLSFLAQVTDYSPTSFLSTTPIIAPFWADVDTRPANGGQVWYRTTTNGLQLDAISSEIRTGYPGADAFNATFAQIVTWDRVGYYQQRTDKLNTFQATVVSDGILSYAIFKYPTNGINWAQTDYGTSSSWPLAGFSAGDAVNYYEVAGSRTASLLNLPQLTNTVPGSPGTFIFRIDGATISASPSAPPPGPNGSNIGVSIPVWSVKHVAVGNAVVWSPGAAGWDGVWNNGSSANFSNPNIPAAGQTVKAEGGIVASRVTVGRDGYTFGAAPSPTGNRSSLQLSHLAVASDATRVTFGDNLVVLTNLGDAGKVWNGSRWVQGGVLTRGQLHFQSNSILVARGEGAINGAHITLRDNAELQLHTAGATTRASQLTFEKTTQGGGKLDLRGHNTTLGAIRSAQAGAGLITNNGEQASQLTVDLY